VKLLVLPPFMVTDGRLIGRIQDITALTIGERTEKR
jgi:hypothetical protein